MEHLATIDDVLAFIRDHADDLHKVIIPSMPSFRIVDDSGRNCLRTDVGLIFRLLDGTDVLIQRDVASTLITNGEFHKFRLPILITPDLLSDLALENNDDLSPEG